MSLLDATPAGRLTQKAVAAGEDVARPAPTHDNLLIQGDKLEALKALLPLYREEVRASPQDLRRVY